MKFIYPVYSHKFKNVPYNNTFISILWCPESYLLIAVEITGVQYIDKLLTVEL